MRRLRGLGIPSSSISEESVDSSSGGVLLEGVGASSASVFGLGKAFLGGGLGSSDSGTTSVLRERTMGAATEERTRRGGGSGAPRTEARSCG